MEQEEGERGRHSISAKKSSVCVGVGWWGGPTTFHGALLLNQVPTYGSRGYKPNLKHSTPLFLFFKYNIVFS